MKNKLLSSVKIREVRYRVTQQKKLLDATYFHKKFQEITKRFDWMYESIPSCDKKITINPLKLQIQLNSILNSISTSQENTLSFF
jgi:hypothetical protein